MGFSSMHSGHFELSIDTFSQHKCQNLTSSFSPKGLLLWVGKCMKRLWSYSEGLGIG